MNKIQNVSLILVMFVFTIPTFSQWSEPVPVSIANDPSAEDWSPFLTTDGLTLYFARVRSSTSYYGKICAATRDDIDAPFSSVQVLDCPLNKSSGHQLCPWVSCDNLRMYYHNETGGVFRLMLSERKTIFDPWPAGRSIEEINLLGNRIQAPSLTMDELTIFFDAHDISGGKGKYDIWMATRSDRHSSFSQYRNLSEINTEFSEQGQSISPDGLELYFSSNRNGQTQLFKASRDNLDEGFKNIRQLSQFDIPGKSNAQPSLSYNGREFYFTQAQSGNRSTKDIYVSYFSGDSSSFMNKLSTESYYEIEEKDNEK